MQILNTRRSDWSYSSARNAEVAFKLFFPKIIACCQDHGACTEGVGFTGRWLRTPERKAFVTHARMLAARSLAIKAISLSLTCVLALVRRSTHTVYRQKSCLLGCWLHACTAPPSASTGKQARRGEGAKPTCVATCIRLPMHAWSAPVQSMCSD